MTVQPFAETVAAHPAVASLAGELDHLAEGHGQSARETPIARAPRVARPIPPRPVLVTQERLCATVDDTLPHHFTSAS